MIKMDYSIKIACRSGGIGRRAGLKIRFTLLKTLSLFTSICDDKPIIQRLLCIPCNDVYYAVYERFFVA
jgi:hypothetical protein